MNLAAVPGSDRKRGHCSALGQEPSLWQGEKEEVDQGVHSQIRRQAVTSAHGCQCLYREAKESQMV